MKKEKSETVELYRQLPQINFITCDEKYVKSTKFCKINGEVFTDMPYEDRIYIDIDMRDIIPCRVGLYKSNVLMIPICLHYDYNIIRFAKEHYEQIPDNNISETDIEKAKNAYKKRQEIRNRKFYETIEKRKAIRKQEQEDKRKKKRLRDLVSEIENMGWSVSLSPKE